MSLVTRCSMIQNESVLCVVSVDKLSLRTILFLSSEKYAYQTRLKSLRDFTPHYFIHKQGQKEELFQLFFAVSLISFIFWFCCTSQRVCFQVAGLYYSNQLYIIQIKLHTYNFLVDRVQLGSQATIIQHIANKRFIYLNRFVFANHGRNGAS